MNEIDIFNFIFKGTSEGFDSVQQELAKLLAIGQELRNESLRYQAEKRKEREESKKAADEAKQAAITEINARLGITTSLSNEIGIIQKLQNEQRLLRQLRAESNSVADINRYTAALQASQRELNTLTGATNRFSGSNGFWREMQGWVAGALAVSQLKEWTGEIFKAQSQVEGFRLSLNRLVGEGQAKVIEQQLKTLIVDTPLGFENATKGVERLIFAYQNAGVSTKNIVKDFEAFGNVAKGSDENLKGIVKALDDVANQGKLTGQEIMQFGNAGVNIIGLLAESTGKTRKEIMEMKSDGALSFDLVREAIIKAGSEGGKFAGAMSVAMTTVSGRFAQYKDAVFFAMANVGNYFADSAKKTVTWATSVVQALFGTESATRRTVEILKIAAEALGIYVLALKSTEIWTKAVAVAETAWLVVQKATTIIRGELILLTRQQAIANNTLSLSQQEAALSAMVLNEALIANPWGAIIALVGTAIVAYQTFNAIAKETQELTVEGIKRTDEEIKGLIQKKIAVNAAADSVFKLREGSDAYKIAVGNLIKQAPEYFGQLDAETAKYSDIRKALLLANTELERKIRLMANEKLAEKVSGKVADSRLAIAEAEMKHLEDQKMFAEMFGKSSQKMKLLIHVQNIELGALRAAASKDELLLQKVTTDQLIEQQTQYNARYQELVNKKKNGEFKTQKEFNEAILTLNKEFFDIADNQTVTATKTTNDKVKKEKIDSAKTRALIDEKAANDALAKTLDTERQSLILQKQIDEQRIKDKKLSKEKEKQELRNIEIKYDADSRALDDKYLKEEMKLQDGRLEFQKGVNKALGMSESERIANSLKVNKKYLDDGIKQDEKNAKEAKKLEEEKFELLDKLRILDKISRAKTSKEVVEIQNKETEEILKRIKEEAKARLLIEQLKLIRLRDTLGEESEEYKKQKGVVLALEQAFTKASVDLVDFVTDKTKDAYKTRAKEAQQALSFMEQMSSTAFDIINRGIDRALANTTDAVQRANLQAQKENIDIAKNALSAIGSFASGDVAGGVLKAFGTVVGAIDSLMERSNRIAEAKFEEAKRQLEEFLQVVESDVAQLISALDEIAKTYESIDANIASKFNNSFDEILRSSTVDLIDREVERGQLIIDNYNKAVEKVKEWYEEEKGRIEKTYDLSIDNEKKRYGDAVDKTNKEYDLKIRKENEAYDKAVENLNKQYDLEIQRINEKYNLIDEKATQQYNKETLGILAAGSVQLEALIKNEDSLNSVRTEFAAKRQFINETFALANKQLTADSTQAEIDAVNASIAARDAALAELQQWYNDELTYIVTSEGQKRKEYTDTEKIQNQIKDNLDKAALKFQADEIKRISDRANELVKAEENKNKKFEILTGLHNDELLKLENEKLVNLAGLQVAHDLIMQQIEELRLTNLAALQKQYNDGLIALEKDKNEQLAASYERLKTLLVVYADEIGRALENSAAKGTEAYKALEAELVRVKNLIDAIGGSNIPVPVVPPTINPGIEPIVVPRFFKGTDRLHNYSGANGVDTELIKADVGERILPTKLNDMLKSKFGKDIKNTDLVNLAMANYTSIDYARLASVGMNVSSSDPKLTKAIEGLSSKLGNIKQLNVSLSKSGVSLEERTGNRIIRRKQ